MIVLAVLLLLVAAAVVAFVVLTGSTAPVSLDWTAVGSSVSTTALVLFLVGAGTLLVAELGVGLLVRGQRRSWQRRRELKHLQRVQAEQQRHAAPGPTTSTGPTPAVPASPSSAPATAPTPAVRPDGTAGGGRGGATREGDGSAR